MTNENGGTLRGVVWSEICPWLRIFRCFRLAIDLRVLVLAAVGVVLTLSVWAALYWLFSGDPEQVQWMGANARCPWVAINHAVADRPTVPRFSDLSGSFTAAPDHWRVLHTRAFLGTWGELVRPLAEAFRSQRNIAGLACAVLCGLSSLAIWAFFGGAISRIAAVQLAAQEQISCMSALRYACSKWLAYFAAPLFPVLGIVLAAVPVCILGLLLRADVGVLLAALVWPLALLGGLIMAVLLLGLLFGWPLMWGTISAEGTDSFDALSRSYAYVFQRPLHYLFYAIVAAVLGALGWLLVANFAAGIIWLTYWAASWGGGGTRVLAGIAQAPESLEGAGYYGAALIHFWAGFVKLLAVGFLYSYFWTAATAIYFLLRRDVDATEMDEVFLEADESEPPAGPPPVKTDAAGAPAVSGEDLAAPPGQPGPAENQDQEEPPANEKG